MNTVKLENVSFNLPIQCLFLLVMIVPEREEKLIQALGLGNPGPIGTKLLNIINGTSSALEMQSFELDVNEQQAGTHCSRE